MLIEHWAWVKVKVKYGGAGSLLEEERWVRKDDWVVNNALPLPSVEPPPQICDFGYFELELSRGIEKLEVR